MSHRSIWRQTCASSGTVALLLAALLLAPLCIAPVFADTVYSQSSNFPFGGNAASQHDPNYVYPNLYTAYDNFTLGTTTQINQVAWYGEFVPNQNSVSITAFTFSFYSDRNGQPGSALFSATVAGSGNQTFSRTTYGVDEYSYSSLLPQPFQAVAGQKYWLSIVSTLSFPTQWYWSESAGGDGFSYIDVVTTGGTNRQQEAYDLAFSLGSPVPEASTTVSFGLLLALGLGGLSIAGMRRKAASRA